MMVLWRWGVFAGGWRRQWWKRWQPKRREISCWKRWIDVSSLLLICVVIVDLYGLDINILHYVRLWIIYFVSFSFFSCGALLPLILVDLCILLALAFWWLAGGRDSLRFFTQNFVWCTWVMTDICLVAPLTRVIYSCPMTLTKSQTVTKPVIRKNTSA